MAQWSISMRPHTLNEVHGQDHIKKYFYNVVKDKKPFPTAMLFQGQFGCGKTTIAKIVTQMLVCKHPKENGDPCCECPACKDIMDETFSRDNVLQIDGGQASKDEVIDKITDFVSTPAWSGGNKVLILEEVQELSTKAKNSLLKTLEKPVKGIHYIMTSMEDLKASGLTSRCQVFKFPPVQVSELMMYLADTMEKIPYKGSNLWESEDVPNDFKMEGVKAIAESANGSYRMALQMLEQCVESDMFKPEEIQSKLGIVSTTTFLNLLMSMMNGKDETKVYNTLIEGDYNANFSLIFKVISDAECLRVFGAAPGNNDFFNKQAKMVCSHQNFQFVRDTICNFAAAHQSYIKKSEYVVMMAKMYDICKRANAGYTGVTPVNINNEQPLQRRVVRRS